MKTYLRRAAIAIPVALAVAGAISLPAGAASEPKPAILGIAAVPRIVKPSGATVHYLAETNYATRCQITSVPVMPGLPLTVPCSGTKAVAEASFKVPADKTTRYIDVGITAYGPGGSSVETIVLEQTTVPTTPPPVITRNANGKPFAAGQACPSVDIGASLKVGKTTIKCVVVKKVDRWEKVPA